VLPIPDPATSRRSEKRSAFRHPPPIDEKLSVKCTATCPDKSGPTGAVLPIPDPATSRRSEKRSVFRHPPPIDDKLSVKCTATCPDKSGPTDARWRQPRELQSHGSDATVSWRTEKTCARVETWPCSRRSGDRTAIRCCDTLQGGFHEQYRLACRSGRHRPLPALVLWFALKRLALENFCGPGCCVAADCNSRRRNKPGASSCRSDKRSAIRHPRRERPQVGQAKCNPTPDTV